MKTISGIITGCHPLLNGFKVVVLDTDTSPSKNDELMYLVISIDGYNLTENLFLSFKNIDQLSLAKENEFTTTKENGVGKFLASNVYDIDGNKLTINKFTNSTHVNLRYDSKKHVEDAVFWGDFDIESFLEKSLHQMIFEMRKLRSTKETENNSGA